MLSARRPELLREHATRMLRFLRPRRDALASADVAYTLQVGRDPATERLAIVASAVGELSEKLASIDSGARAEGVYTGTISDKTRAAEAVVQGELHEMARRWVDGARIEWDALYPVTPHRIWPPARPFEKRRLWPDIPRPERQPAGGPVSGSGSNGHHERPASGERRQVLQDGVRRSVARILKVSESQVDLSTDISEYGLDSINIMLLVAKLREDLGVAPAGGRGRRHPARPRGGC